MEDIRCVCGKLLAKRQGHTIVIKCRHCKRFIAIDLEGTHVLPEEEAACIPAPTHNQASGEEVPAPPSVAGRSASAD